MWCIMVSKGECWFAKECIMTPNCPCTANQRILKPHMNFIDLNLQEVGDYVNVFLLNISTCDGEGGGVLWNFMGV